MEEHLAKMKALQCLNRSRARYLNRCVRDAIELETARFVISLHGLGDGGKTHLQVVSLSVTDITLYVRNVVGAEHTVLFKNAEQFTEFMLEFDLE